MSIKVREARVSRRGIYLQDAELKDTVFQPGESFGYIIDPKERTVVIVPEASRRHTVSKRNYKDTTRPVLDIRSRDALLALRDTEFWRVTIERERIIIEGVNTEAQHGLKDGEVLDLVALCEARAQVTVGASRQVLEQAVGAEQLRFFENINPRRPALDYATRLPLLMDSMFSGAGLLDAGFVNAGFTIAYAVEKDPDAVATYRANLGDHVEQADIRAVPSDRFRSPVMCGGSPCQGMSASNRRTNYLENPNNALVLAYIEAVKSNPTCKIFVLENVPQILSIGNGAFRDEIFEALTDFTISAGVLDAADYGTPQHRRRAFFIGSKIGRIDLPQPTVTRARTVREAWMGLTDQTPNQADISEAKPITLERMAHVPPGGNVHDIPPELRPKGTHSDMYRRLVWDEPAPTMVHPRKALLTHPLIDRVLSVREVARLQDVPDSFVFYGRSLDARQQQVANGVPIHLATAIANQVAQAIHQWTIRQAHRSNLAI